MDANISEDHSCPNLGKDEEAEKTILLAYIVSESRCNAVNGASTLQVRASAMMLLPITGNQER
jgi:hypothetical protein